MASLSLANVLNTGGSNYALYRSSGSQNSTSTTGANTAFVWTTTPVAGKTMGTWSNGGSVWTPGSVGTFMIVWNSNTAMTPSGTSEFSIIYNSTTVTYNANSQIGLSSSPEASIVAIFNSTSPTDIIYFSWYNGNSNGTSTTIQNVGTGSRNQLSIAKITTC